MIRKSLGVVVLVYAFTVSAFAQATPPNRDYKRLIKEIAASCPTVFNANGQFHNAPASDPFRRQIIAYFAAELNKRDGAGKWGVLYRMDRQDETPEHGRLTTDVVIWIPGRLHYDTMGDRNVSWNLIGPLPNDPDWFIHDPSRHSTVCGTVTPPPVDPPAPPPLPPSGELAREVWRLRAELDELKARVNTHLAP